jgi:2'-5' RNA ligase
VSDDATYTTAIIAAVPSPSDPVNQIVAEDAHVTLQFLGEADQLSEEQVSEILQLLGLLSVAISPFTVSISGTAELGPDKAQVLIVQSELLTKIREVIGSNPSVAEITASVEQFPNWIPHLTLAYEGEMPDVGEFTEVEIGSLELWLADAHETFPLTQATAAVTAAGVTTFDPTLHPRGADGRFIEKFGIIKYLKGSSWQYGKVVGIFKDPDHLGTKLTVTPSDLSGNPKGENIVLNPDQVYRAPKAKAHLTITAPGAQKVGGQGGSNPGGLYKIPKPDATQDEYLSGAVDAFYVKKPKTKSHGNNEALANALYEEAGVAVPEVDFHQDGKLYSKVVAGQQDMADHLDDQGWMDKVRRNFAVDAWLGNRDVFGMTYDNIITDGNGTPWRIDNGGALLYRAMGEKKTDFGSKVTELDTFRQGKKAKIFGAGMFKTQEIDGAERVLAISPGQIDELVAAHNLPKSLADTLKARRAYIADYYGLTLPEKTQPAEAEGPTTAPLVDAADIAENKGKTRGWFKTTLAHLGIIGQSGEVVEFPDGKTALYGVSEDGTQPLSLVGTQQQLLGWSQAYQPDAEIMLKKLITNQKPRPEHGSKLLGSDLSQQTWKRGDEISTVDGQLWKIQGWNSDTGAVLVQSGVGQPVLLDTFGSHSTQVYEVHRWDAPAVDTLDITPPPPVPVVVHQLEEESPQQIGQLNQPTAPAPELELAAVDKTLANLAPGKTGQAAAAETAIKADLDTPLPDGNGTPAPSKTSAPGGAKEMVLGDGTKAQTGNAVTSKKDGKTYTFVKPKGQYAVVTDPSSDDPNKQLLKLASTMTQPDKVPAADVSTEAPKTATGEVPAVGMMAVAKDGWAGKITMISPDGKFVFITDPVTNKRKRKSTGAVSITGGTPDSAAAPKTITGPIKAYGPPPTKAAAMDAHALNWDDPADLGPVDMVVVGYADGTHGLEPYTGQPAESLLTNASGKIATPYTIKLHKGTVDAAQFVQATGGDKTQNYQVIWAGTIHQTDGSVGPNGGLVLWDYSDPTSNAFELPPTGQQLSVVYNQDTYTPLPDWNSIPSFQPNDFGAYVPPPLWQNEAKPLTDWKGQIAEGSEISLDGESWLTVKNVYPTGAVEVEDVNGTMTTLMPSSGATYVVKAPELKDAAEATPWKPGTAPATDVTDMPPGPPQKKIGDLAQGDVVTDGNGETTIIHSVTPEDPSTQQVHVTAMGEVFGSPADPNFEFDYHGNITEHPVDIPAGVVAPHLYPGATVQFNSADVPAQVVSYPEQLANGNWKFAVFQDGDPENLALVEVGEPDLGAHISGEAHITAELGSFVSSQESGVDLVKLNDLYNQAKTVDTQPVDHHAAMTDQGVPFGTAGYPIYFNPTDSSYYRQGPNGVEGWENGAWTTDPDHTSVSSFEKVWDGAPFEGKLGVPEGTDLSLYGEATADYQPNPGEAVALVSMGSKTNALIVSPTGSFEPGTQVHTVMVEYGQPVLSSSTYDAASLDVGGTAKLTVLHDPFAEPEEQTGVTHHQGPTPPTVLAQALNKHGWEPQPGDTYWMATKSAGPGQAVLLKQPDGNWKQVNYSNLKDKEWSPEDLKDPAKSGADTHFTWTYVPAGEEGPKPLDGLPQDFQPFVPSEGQAVLKVTLPNGHENVYLQKQPGAGWYAMGPDGTVDESSDAVKSNHVVQMKLAGKGSQAAKYELLHPKPEGDVKPGAVVPTLTNGNGDWTPEAHQKVVALHSYAGDPDPWFYVQDQPGGTWVASENTPDQTTTITDADMQNKLSGVTQESGGSSWHLVYNGDGKPVDTPSGQGLPAFDGYVPQEGDKIIAYTPLNGDSFYYIQKPGEKHYHGISNGQVGQHWALYAEDIPANLGPEHGNDYSQVWPPVEAPAAPTQSFSGYTPQPGDKILSANVNANVQTHWVQQGGVGDYHQVVNGQVKSLSIPPDEIGDHFTQVWPPVAPGGIFAGYQTEAGDNVIELGGPNGTDTYVQKGGTGSWLMVENGQLAPDHVAITQSTVDWAANTAETNNFTVTDLQGSHKGGLPEAGQVEPSKPNYAGVSDVTSLTPGTYNFGTYVPSAAQQSTLNHLPVLSPGQSLYVFEDPTLPGGSTVVLVRDSMGGWTRVYSDGTIGTPIWHSDEEMEAYVAANQYMLHKAQFTAPAKASQASATHGPTTALTGWAEQGIPNPANFSFISSPEEANGAKKGAWVFMEKPDSPGSGIFVQLAEDYDGSGNIQVPVESMHPTEGGTVKNYPGGFTPGAVIPIPLSTDDTNIYFSEVPNAPGNAPSAPSAPAPAVPAAPAYPGAVKPSQEDINAWGGDLTKDGHIPTAGMYVTGKGPMSGKIVSISKDKTKATVLTSDGKKTSRLLSALKTDPSANYQAYAPKMEAKEVPAGMPLAVDSPKEALAKTIKDGKFRAILTGHPGVSGGSMTVTKTTGPSGKNYNRVHLTLTPEQRGQLVAMLAGTGEKGDWVKSSKPSEQVAVGDELPMRLSSTKNPDGSPRWKVDPETKPPTHTVTKIGTDPSDASVKIVTMKNKTTGEEITSRFHSGKALSVYTWDPNKAKTMMPGALNLSAVAKAQGWQLVTDGGISAITGGADKGKLYHEPGSAVSKSALGQLSSSWQTLRNVSADGVVIETVDPKGGATKSSTGTTVISRSPKGWTRRPWAVRWPGWASTTRR